MEIPSFPVFSKQIKTSSKSWEMTKNSILTSRNYPPFLSSPSTKFRNPRGKLVQLCWSIRMENANWLCGIHLSSKTFKSSVWISVNKIKQMLRPKLQLNTRNWGKKWKEQSKDWQKFMKSSSKRIQVYSCNFQKVLKPNIKPQNIDIAIF